LRSSKALAKPRERQIGKSGMRLWKKAAASVPVAAVPLRNDEQRVAADARAKVARERAAFTLVIALIARDKATPALGKSTPRGPRAQD
jgi:hypothetical protein